MYNPFTVCFIPKGREEEVRAAILGIVDIGEQERSFLNNQVIGYETNEETDGTIELGERIESLSEDIGSYARLVLPNIRLFYGNEGLTEEDAVEMLREGEVKIGEGRFGSLGKGGLYAVKKEEYG